MVCAYAVVHVCDLFQFLKQLISLYKTWYEHHAAGASRMQYFCVCYYVKVIFC